MGWLFSHRSRELVTDREFFEREFPGVVDVASTFDAAYIAYRRENGQTVAIVALKRWVKDYCNFGYKDIGESSGPNVDHCPERILRLLSPVEQCYDSDSAQNYAADWRARCWKHINERKSLVIKAGSVVETKAPITFRSGREARRFRIESVRPWEIMAYDGSTWFRARLGRKTLVDNGAVVV